MCIVYRINTLMHFKSRTILFLKEFLVNELRQIRKYDARWTGSCEKKETYIRAFSVQYSNREVAFPTILLTSAVLT